MIVLIVDDEEHVREGIDLAVDWDKFGVVERLYAEDGRTALELVHARKPSVMFCDMSMAGMDGIELLDQIRGVNNTVQIIVISGYDDFQYTRAAIRAGGVDYLLKPFSKRELEHALERALSAWRMQEHRQSEQRESGFLIRKADAYMDEQKLVAYVKGETPPGGIRSILNKIGLPEQSLRTALILPRHRTELVKRRFGGDGELFFFAAGNILHESIRALGRHYFCRLDDEQWLLLTAFTGPLPSAREHSRMIEKAVKAWRDTIGLEVRIGLSEADTDGEQLLKGIGEARSALLRSEVLEGASGQGDKNDKAEQEQEFPRLIDQQFLLQRALEDRNVDFASNIIRTFAQRLRRGGTLRMKDLQAYTVEANHMLQHARRQLSENEPADVLLPLWISDLDEWEDRLIHCWEALIEQRGEEGGGVRGIQAIKDYIDGHFQEDISLSTLSDRFNFSPQYIAKRFKELYGATVTTYVTNFRMDKAKSLLLHTEMTVAEIANQLGYSDENYFGKVFKKQEGLSPMHYRKERRDS
jgi:two-component system response regulator YesN